MTNAPLALSISYTGLSRTRTSCNHALTHAQQNVKKTFSVIKVMNGAKQRNETSANNLCISKLHIRQKRHLRVICVDGPASSDSCGGMDYLFRVVVLFR